jgi:hypothetical protein
MINQSIDITHSQLQVAAETRTRILQEAKRQIWVSFQREGIHKYPAALEDPKLATNDQYDVSFLGYPHRHIFHFRVSIDVFHNNRDIEFIQFKRWLQGLYSNQDTVLSLDYKSCEMIADDLYQEIAKRYPNRSVIIEVSEDGENGCVIEYPTHKPYQSIKI